MMMKTTAISIACLLSLGMLASNTAPAPLSTRDAASAFIKTLRPDARATATIPFDDANRFDWHYIPRDRRGLSLREMNDSERRAAHALLRAALSASGYLKTTMIMELDQELHEREVARGRAGTHRDASLYYFTIFGDPSADGPWAWRVEGHHVSLNFTMAGSQLVAVTPAFLGANPAEIATGRRSGWRPLADEEDLGRALMRSLNPEQRGRALIAPRPPRDIILSPGNNTLEEAEGIPAIELDDDQRASLRAIIDVYVDNIDRSGADDLRARIRAAGTDSIRFAWAGSLEPNEPHYYRVHGPTFVIEFDNIQNAANHIHCVLRDLEDDFGGRALQRHLDDAHSID